MFVIVILRKGSHLDTFLKGDNLIMIQARFCIFGQVPPDPYCHKTFKYKYETKIIQLVYYIHLTKCSDCSFFEYGFCKM